MSLPPGAVSEVTSEILEGLKSKAFKMLDHGRGRCVQIDANVLIDLCAYAQLGLSTTNEGSNEIRAETPLGP